MPYISSCSFWIRSNIAAGELKFSGSSSSTEISTSKASLSSPMIAIISKESNTPSSISFAEPFLKSTSERTPSKILYSSSMVNSPLSYGVWNGAIPSVWKTAANRFIFYGCPNRDRASLRFFIIGSKCDRNLRNGKNLGASVPKASYGNKHNRKIKLHPLSQALSQTPGKYPIRKDGCPARQGIGPPWWQGRQGNRRRKAWNTF